MKYFKSKSNTGFTLLEAVLYLAIAGTVLYFISGFAFNSIFGKAKIETFQNINQNSQSVLDELSNTIGNSEGVNGFIGNIVLEVPPQVGCSATGGATSTADGYMIHTFTTVGNSTFTVASGSCDAEVLVVAGGGGAGTSIGGYRGGGGGAGGYRSDNLSISEGDYSVVVGAGGPVSNNGLNSSFYNLIAIGGGAGGNSQYGLGAIGGSGGGAASLNSPGGNGTTGQGYAGGGGSGGYNAGGGGGAGGAALAGWETACADGGVGVSNSISGTAIVYAAGGRGTYNCAVSPVVPNRGNGGYSSNTGSVGGGSGIVIVRYPIVN